MQSFNLAGVHSGFMTGHLRLQHSYEPCVVIVLICIPLHKVLAACLCARFAIEWTRKCPFCN